MKPWQPLGKTNSDKNPFKLTQKRNLSRCFFTLYNKNNSFVSLN